MAKKATRKPRKKKPTKAELQVKLAQLQAEIGGLRAKVSRAGSLAEAETAKVAGVLEDLVDRAADALACSCSWFERAVAENICRRDCAEFNARKLCAKTRELSKK